MRVTIWDMDYYYAKDKTNCFNPDAMKISSFHKQSGDLVTFVKTEFDINRPYDLYYIIKNNDKLPHPPKSFFLARNIRWWGKAYKSRIKWKMSDAMLACRPDYLLYPERDTREERSEQIRLFNNEAKLLPITQDWTNTFKNKYAIVTDTTMWFSDEKSIIKALKILQGIKKVSFFEPIWIQKIVSNKIIREEFLKLNFVPGSKISWTMINLDWVDPVIDFIKEFKDTFSHVSSGEILIDWHLKDHWEDKNNAISEFEMLKRMIIRCKKEGFSFTLKMPESRFETPYFEVFEELSNWTKTDFKSSWLHYLSKRYGNRMYQDAEIYWNNPSKWHDLFRDLLRQTYEDKEFILEEWKGTRVSENQVPWNLWKKQFEYGL